jgi:hypothetical protein
MPLPRNGLTDQEMRDDADRQTAGLAGVAIILVLLVAGLFLVHTLYNKSKIEDCLMAGRLNCDPLVLKR